MKKLSNTIKKSKKGLFSTFEDGYEYKFQGRPFEKMKYIKKIKKVTDLALVAIPPPIVE